MPFYRTPWGNTGAILLTLLTLLTLIPCAFAITGVDVSTAVSQKQWTCLQGPGGQGPVEFAVARVYTETGHVDSTGVGSIKAARAAGIKYVDGYIFPCVSCGNPAGQVSAAHSACGSACGMLWLDIEVLARMAPSQLHFTPLHQLHTSCRCACTKSGRCKDLQCPTNSHDQRSYQWQSLHRWERRAARKGVCAGARVCVRARVAINCDGDGHEHRQTQASL